MPKKPFLLNIIGILLLLLGLAISFSFFIQLKSGYSIKWDEELFLIAGCFISSYGLLLLKPWGRFWANLVISFSLLDLISAFFLDGPSTNEIFFITGFSLTLLPLWYLNRKEIKELFDNKKSYKVIGVIWIIILFIVTGFFVYLWIDSGGYKTPKLDKIFYTNDKLPSSYERTIFPLSFSICIPNDFKLLLVGHDKETGIGITLRNSKKDLIGLTETTLLQRGYKENFDNPYDYAYKIFSERIGINFIGLKRLSNIIAGDVYKIEEVEINNFKIFVQKGKSEIANGMSFHLFFDGQSAGGGELRSYSKEIGEKEMNEIIASLAPKKDMLPAEEYFNQGKELLKSGELEKAKIYFACALCKNWNDPDFHFYLAECFYKTKGYSQAEWHFKETLKLKADYPMADVLLQKAKDERIKAKKQQQANA